MCCSGYKGPSCTQAICYGSTSCPNGGTCSSPDRCSCRLGFGGSRCQDINECSMRNGGCNHICKNSIGSYQCDCKNGFYLASDGKTCEDINECSKNNGDCNQNCKNVDGSYNCFCMDGYKLARDGKMCEDIDECLDMTCLNNGSCVNVLGSYSCQCNQGFSGDVCQSVHVNEKSNNSMAVGLGTSISLIFVVVAVLFVAYLKTRHKKLSTPNDTQSTSEIYQSTQIRTSMNEYESVVVKEVVKVDSKTGGLSPYDNIQIKGIHTHIVIPMLPTILSEELCSLNSNQDRLTFSVIWNISEKGEKAKYFCTGCIDDEDLYRHYALNVPLYTHFTSPIRRYADVEVHRTLAAALDNSELSEKSTVAIQSIAENCNDRKNNAKQVSDLSEELFFAVFVKKPDIVCQHFRAVIKGIHRSNTTCGVGSLRDVHVTAICYGSTSCPNGGTCSSPDTCSCRPGFGGSRCEDFNECLDITCLNNGSCLNYDGSYACQCNQGFSGDVCQSDINECLLSNDTCDDQCINTNGSFYCKCTGGSSSLSEDGVSCKVNVKEKSYNSVAVGLGTGLSLALAIVAVVFLAVLKNRHKRPSSLEETNQISHGYQPTQIWNSMNEYESVVVTQAVKVNDESERHISPYDNIQIEDKTIFCTAICYGSTSCPNGGTCFLPDTCLCAAGFDGLQCSDINECHLGTHNCQQLCTNTNGSFTCSCRTGYTLNNDQTTCTDINECHESNNCTQLCNNTMGSYDCNCHQGYQLERNGFTCTDINECLDITCLNNGSCVNVEGSHSCQCKQGFSGDVCQSDVNGCLPHNGTCDDECINTNGSFYCKCNGDSMALSEDGVTCIAHVSDKTYSSIGVGLGTESKSTSNRYQSTHIENRMNKYESVTVKEVVKVDGETEGQISQYDSTEIKGIIEHNGQQEPDRGTAVYENLVIFRK
ncbi:unnamed protein product [Mytilus edulis]|uniref:EGF-like domain-containing protein n=1 Tax=Mytilus edulis TaxID=6550 RepID=A0A8S3SJ43_MYTED|nr:unnamed protein product [Mytilus edulis]